MMRRSLMMMAGASFVLASCGAQDDAEGDAAPQAAPLPPAAVLNVSDYFPNISGGDGATVRALAALPQDPPWAGRLVAAVTRADGSGALTFIDLAVGALTTLDFPAVTALATAPEFELRGLAAPLVIAAGGELDGVEVSLVFSQEPDPNIADGDDLFSQSVTLAPVPTTPIAPDLDIERICPLRATDAVVEFVVVDADYAEVWRVRDAGAEQLLAERVDDAPQAVGAQACAFRDGGRGVFTDEAGRFGEAPARFSALATVSLGATVAEDVVIAAQEEAGGLVALEPETGALIGAFTVSGGLNTPDVQAAEALLVSDASYGGSYNRGVLAVALDGGVSIISLDGVVTQLQAL